jgi:hypothetical protein
LESLGHGNRVHIACSDQTIPHYNFLNRAKVPTLTAGFHDIVEFRRTVPGYASLIPIGSQCVSDSGGSRTRLQGFPNAALSHLGQIFEGEGVSGSQFLSRPCEAAIGDICTNFYCTVEPDVVTIASSLPRSRSVASRFLASIRFVLGR